MFQIFIKYFLFAISIQSIIILSTFNHFKQVRLMRKFKILLLIVFLSVFLNIPSVVSADELSDLKDKFKMMQDEMSKMYERIEKLETEKAAKSEVEEVKEKVEIVELQSQGQEDESLFSGINIGGHLKFYMFDRSQGKRNGDSQQNNFSAGINHFYLYFSKTLSEWLNLHVETDTSVTASATPALGSDISRATSGSTSTSIHQAYLITRTPNDYEFKIGLFNPIFSEDYAKEIWWDQQYHLNQGFGSLASWHDSGIEMYKNIDFEEFSLPIYLYYLNGNVNSSGQYVDNNNGKTFLAHFSPEFFNTRLRLLGSIAYGKWDNDDKYNLFSHAVGFNFKYDKFDFLYEFIYRKYENLSLTGGDKEDGTRDGYQTKLLYRFNEKWRGVINYSNVDLYNTGSTSIRTDTYETLTLGVNYFITESSIIIGQFSLTDADRSDDTESIDFERFTLGWRTTF